MAWAMAENYKIVGGALFADNEIQQGDPRPAGERLKQRIDNRRSALLNIVNRIVRGSVWGPAFADWQRLEAESTSELHSQWNNAYASQDRQGMLNVLRLLEKKLLEFEVKHEEAFVLAEHGLSSQAAAEMAANRVLELLRPEMAKRLDAIDEAQKRLDETKKALDASKSFGELVKSLVASSDRSSALWTLAIVLLLVGGAVVEFKLDIAPDAQWYNALFLRLSVLIPLTYLVYFMWGQYKLARMTHIKYRHVEGLLNGGANAVIDMFRGREEFKNRLHERLAEELLSVDSIMAALSGAATPVEDAVKLLKSTTDVLGEAGKLKA